MRLLSLSCWETAVCTPTCMPRRVTHVMTQSGVTTAVRGAKARREATPASISWLASYVWMRKYTILIPHAPTTTNLCVAAM